MSTLSTHSHPIKLWQILGYMGLLPFMVCIAISLFIPEHQWIAKEGFVYYSAIILSFVAGTLWRMDNQVKMGKQQVISNLFSLVAFFSLFLEPWPAIAVLATSYFIIFLFERYFTQDKTRDKKYLFMRFWLTTIVVLLHIVAMIFWL